MTPRFNTVLYLHHKVARKTPTLHLSTAQGLSEIENLDEYSGLKCLWLESNIIAEIKGDCQNPQDVFCQLVTGLDHLQSLKCLYLHENRIEEISVRKPSPLLKYPCPARVFQNYSPSQI